MVNRKSLYGSNKSLANRIVIILIHLCFIPNMIWGQKNTECFQNDSIRLVMYADSLINLANSSYKTGNYEDAVRYGTEVVEIRKKILGVDHPDYAVSLNCLAAYYYKHGDYTEAVRIGKEAMDNLKRIYGADNIDYKNSMYNLAQYYCGLGNYSEAIKYGTEIMEFRKRDLGPNHPDYAKSLNNLAVYYSALGNYSEAAKLAKEAIGILKQFLGINHPEYIASLYNLTLLNYELGNFGEAVKYGIEIVEIQKEIYGVDHPDYIKSLLRLSDFYSKLGNFSEAVKLGKEALDIQERTLGIGHPSYAKSLDLLAFYYSKLGNYSEAVRLGKEVMMIQKRNLGVDHPDYATSLIDLAQYYLDFGNYPEAIRLGTVAMEIRKKVLGADHPDYVQSLNNLAIPNALLGNYLEAIKFWKEAMGIVKRTNGVKHENYERALSNLAACYTDLGDYTEATRYITEAMEVCKDIFGDDSPAYATNLMIQAFINYHLGKYAEAIRLGTDALDLQKKCLGADNVSYAETLGNLAVFNFAFDSYVDADRFGTEAMEIFKRIHGVNHPNYAKSLVLLAEINYKLSDYSKVVQNISLASDIYSKTITSNFSELSSRRRQLYWDGIKGYFFRILPQYTIYTSDSTLISLLYDKTALLAKGILLNTDLEMKKIIEESGDADLIKDYQTVVANYEYYNKQIDIPISKRIVDTDSLITATQRLEDDLIHKSKELGDYMRSVKLTWKDVQQSLGDNEIAIEFFDVHLAEDSVIYIALTLRKDSEFPKMTVLFEDKQLKQIPDTLYYQCKEMADLVWAPLLAEVQGIKNIYFSPSGELHKIGIEYLPGMEEYNLFRLSSTRELVKKKKKQPEDSAVLYGGLDYYAKIDTIGNDKSQSLLDDKYVERANVRGMKLRGGKEYLPHTKEEVEQIATELRNAKWTCQLDTLDKGTEESFKSLSGKRVNTMHISTHGFYYTPEEADRMGYDFLWLDNQRASTEDKALTRTGLIMSGANHILEGEELPDNVEDGILTAKEIADVDLRGLDLVVLSACQTGLGDISQGEGVFGLQRGFKKAGANSILMSLWEVNDEATQILMTQFYKNLVSGQSKRQSLLSAQKYLREYNNGCFDEPKYWAAFILLDGYDNK